MLLLKISTTKLRKSLPQAGGVSGTQMRGFIKDGDEDSFKKFST
jgi:hypothetical protein